MDDHSGIEDSTSAPADTPKKNYSLIWATLAGIGASICCVGPLVVLMLGIGGAWASNLTALEPVRPYFIAITLLFLFLAFRKLYLVPQSCNAGKICANPKVIRTQRILFWVVSILVSTLLAFPWYASIFY